MSQSRNDIVNLVVGDAFEVTRYETGRWVTVPRTVVRVLKDAVLDDAGEKWRRANGEKSPKSKELRYGRPRAQIAEEAWARVQADAKEADEIGTRLHRIYNWRSWPIAKLRKIAAIIDEATP